MILVIIEDKNILFYDERQLQILIKNIKLSFISNKKV